MRSIIATVLFLLLTIIFSILSVPAAVLDRSGRSYLWLARLWSKCFLVLYGIKVEAHGLHHIESGKNYVYTANHSSYTDIPVVLATIPDNIRLMLRHTLTRIPIWGWALLVSPFLIIDRSSASKAKRTIDKAIDTIHKGASVLLFPEGTRTATGHLQEFKRGAFKLAYDSGATVLPIALQGTYDVLPRHKRLPATGKKVVLKVGHPLEADHSLASDRHRENDLMQRAFDETRILLS